MNNRNYIINELNEISPRVAQIGSVNPYQVPAGYFEGLAEQVLQRAKAGEEVKFTVLQQAGNNPYTVPQSYFDGLADTILNRIKTEEAELSDDLRRAGNNPYRIPQGYFDGLADDILKRVKAEEAANPTEELEILSPLLNKIDKKAPFSTPAGYFGELTDNAVAGAKAIEFVNEELENLSPVMNSLKSKQVYEVPAGYFENLPAQVLEKAKGQQPAKVVSMSFPRKMMRYATAAVVAGLIITAGWIYLGGNNTEDPAIPAGDSLLATTVELENISDELLEGYIDNQTIGLTEAPVATSYEIDANDMKDLLAEVSDEELQQYLEKYNLTNDGIQTN